MDLKTMLNDSSVQKQPPRLDTPQSSFDRTAERETPYDVRPDRQSSYPPSSSHVLDSRSQPGSYFTSHSPAPNSASTLSVGPPSAYVQSPGAHGPIYTPRDGPPPRHSYPPQYMASPSAAGPQPSTPGSAHYFQGHNQNSVYGNAHTPTAIAGRQPTREEMIFANGIQARHMSPPAFTQQQTPLTPLGPPVSYSRPSPQSQRPVSQGYDHYRRSSISSVGSTQSREYPAQPLAHPDLARVGSTQRPHLGEEDRQRERERSLESVSPKTIPRPTPQRQQSMSYSQEFQPNVQQVPPPSAEPLYNQTVNEKRVDQQSNHNSTASARANDMNEQSTQSSGPSPGPRTVSSVTPQSVHSSLPAQPSPSVNKQSSLKRSNSILSTPPSSMPPRKRPRRDEVPIFAQSARRGKPLRLDQHGPPARPPRKSPAPRNSPAPKREDEPSQVTNGHSQLADSGRYDDYVRFKPGKEPSFTNTIPYEDLVRQACDWIAGYVVHATPPLNSHFEIEAKLGRIIDSHTNDRLVLPVSNEAILKREMFDNNIRFASTMDERHHKHYNKYLNEVAQQSHRDLQSTNPDREVLRYKHLRESDEFFELTMEGRKALPQALTHWLSHSRHAPKVRKTYDISEGGTLKEQIIKLRIADMEVYNPNTPFDYRISLSLEIKWDGENSHLVPRGDSDQDRQKDRISYRHMYDQMDLTQVSYSGSSKKEHELEVEIYDGQIEHELDLLRNRQESNYEDLIRTFINDVRLLCRAGVIKD